MSEKRYVQLCGKSSFGSSGYEVKPCCVLVVLQHAINGLICGHPYVTLFLDSLVS